MTPMIDVIFLLIIFFLCVNQFQKVETDTNVQLPTASRENVEQANEAQSKRVILNVQRGEDILVGGRRISADRLASFLLEQKGKSAEPIEVWIRSDRSVPYGEVEPILMACAEAGVWDVSFKVIAEDAGIGGVLESR